MSNTGSRDGASAPKGDPHASRSEAAGARGAAPASGPSDRRVRLQKVLAQAGVASRRAAEQMIKSGRVQLNGAVVREMGVRIDPAADRVTVDGKPIELAEAKTTILLYKPDAVVSTMRDPEGRKTVRSIVAGEPYRLLPVGRLDFHTEGALLMSNDGELTFRLLHPRFGVPKTYVVKIAGRPSERDLDRLREGVELEDGRTAPAVVSLLESADRATWLEIIITEGKNRQVRRMCEAIDHRPLRVVRTAFSTIDLGGLRPGQYRYLSSSELGALYGLVELKPEPLSPRAQEVGLAPLGTAIRGRGAIPTGERGP